MTWAPVDQLDFDVAATGKLIDHGSISDIDRAFAGIQIVTPIALAEGDGADVDIVLGQSHREVSIAAAHAS